LQVSSIFCHEKIFSNIFYYASFNADHFCVSDIWPLLCLPGCCQTIMYYTIITFVSYAFSCS
jgi:hypothetical protein